MTLPDALRVLRYWRRSPPVHDLLAIITRVFTTWTPSGEGEGEDVPLPVSDLPEFED
jgi:hypothetical protein